MSDAESDWLSDLYKVYVEDDDDEDNLDGPHWDKYNPWPAQAGQRLRYISLGEADALLRSNPVNPSMDRVLAMYGHTVDPYLLRSAASGTVSFGIRYGPEPGDYLSLDIRQADPDLVLSIWNDNTPEETYT